MEQMSGKPVRPTVGRTFAKPKLRDVDTDISPSVPLPQTNIAAIEKVLASPVPVYEPPVVIDSMVIEQVRDAPVQGSSVTIDQQGEMQPVSSRDYIETISDLWSAAQKNFVQIGRYLIAAKERLPHGHYETMIAEELPFSRANANMFRTIAEAIDNKKVEERQLPRDITAAYHVVTLNDVGLAKAAEQGMLRPETKRTQVLQFKAALKAEQQTAQTGKVSRGVVDVKSLGKSKVRLTTQLARIEQQKSLLERDEAKLRAELIEIENMLLAAKEAELLALAELTEQS